MIKQDKIKFKDGTIKTHVRVVKGVRPGPKMPPKQVTIKSFGYLEDQEDLGSFWKEVNELNGDIKEGGKKHLIITLPKDEKNNAESNKAYNYGYRFIESAVDELGIKDFFDSLDFRGEYSLYEVFEFLLFQRILNPASKRNSIQEIDKFYHKKYDFELYDAYRALDKFSEFSVKLQTHLNSKIKKLIGRDTSFAFYDVTNYYFEKDFNGPSGTYPQKGVSKEHQLSPIVQFGLFMDANSLPIAMKVYPGNTSDSITLQPAMVDIKRDFNLGRLIVVADKGLNSTSNIDYICNNGDGYVVSQILRGPKGSRYHDIMFTKEGYEGGDEFRYKIFEEEYEGNINTKKKVKRRRKVLIYWSKEDASYAKAKRREKVLKAERDLGNNVYSVDHSKKEYITTQYFAESTGEKADTSISGVNYDKIAEEEKFDGYFCIITSELEYDYKKILEVYRNLWHIEESFKITKSDLETRPMYVTTQKHIDGHLLVCFVSLLVLRMIQLKMGEKQISIARMKKVLNNCNCKILTEAVIMLDSVTGKYSYEEKELDSEGKYATLKLNKDEDDIRKDFLTIMKTYGIDLDKSVMERKDFNKELRKIKYKYRK